MGSPFLQTAIHKLTIFAVVAAFVCSLMVGVKRNRLDGVEMVFHRLVSCVIIYLLFRFFFGNVFSFGV